MVRCQPLRCGDLRRFASRLVPDIGMFHKTAASQRQYCTKCGGHLMTNHPPLGLIDGFASTVPSLSFRPALHVNYAETVLPMRDGLPKFKDFPAEIGGSGEQMRSEERRVGKECR